MRGHAIDHRLGFAVAPQKVRADDRVRPFHLMVDRLADVVQQPRPLRRHHLQAQFRRHQSHQVRYFHRMIQNILRITVPEMQPPQKLHYFRMHRRQTRFRHRSLAHAHDGLLHLLVDLAHDLFDARGMDAPVLDQPPHRLPRHLPAHWIEARQQHRPRRIVN